MQWRFWRWNIWSLMFSHTRLNGLRGSIEIFKGELAARKACLTDTEQTTRSSCWFEQASTMLHEAEIAVRQGNVDVGWKCLHAARRIAYQGLGMSSLRTEAQALMNESDKLEGWRKTTVRNLLAGCAVVNTSDPTPDLSAQNPTGGTGQDPLSIETVRARVFRSAEVRDEHFDNVYFKIRLLNGQFFFLAICFIVAFSAMVTLSFRDNEPRIPHGELLWYSAADTAAQATTASPQGDTLTDTSATLIGQPADTTGSRSEKQPENAHYRTRDLLPGIILFGLLGAIFSAGLTLARTSLKSTIPEQIARWPVTVMRLLLGASSAVVIFLTLNTDIAPRLVEATVRNTHFVYLLSFAAGFSERMVPNALAKVTGDKQIVEEVTETVETPTADGGTTKRTTTLTKKEAPK